MAENKGKIRIAYVLPADVRGGVEEHVLSLINHIDRSQFEPYLVAPPDLADSLAVDFNSDVTVLRLRISSLRQFPAMAEFFRFLRTHRIHIVNTHMFIATFYYVPVARLAGVPIILETTHLLEKWRLEKGFLRRNSFIIDWFFYRLLDKVLAVSHACKSDLIRIKKLAADQIVVVQNGRDLQNFSPAVTEQRAAMRTRFGYGDSELLFGVFGRLEEQKGHKYLLEALHILNSRGKKARFIFFGEGALRQDLTGLSEKLCLTDQVAFAGFQKDVPALLSMIDVKVLPSLYEGLPLCVIEALAMEKPVIATAVDGTPEIVRDHENGLLVPARDPKALADTIEYALDHPDEMAAMGKRGREFVVNHFSLQRQVAETEAIYLELYRSHGVTAQ